MNFPAPDLFSMTIGDAIASLEALAEGRIPDQDRVLRGLNALAPFLLQSGRGQDLHDAASMLELLLATGGTASMLSASRTRAPSLAAAVRGLMTSG